MTVARRRRVCSRRRRAVEDGVDHLFVGGGDGTLNEALNGVARLPGGLDAVTLRPDPARHGQ